jgi:hypothetical protein
VYTNGLWGKVKAAYENTFTSVLVFVLVFGLFVVSKFVKRSRAKARKARVQLEGDEVSVLLGGGVRKAG